MNTSPRFLLRIPRAIYDELLTQASAELPYECCGLLAGRIAEDGATAEVMQHYALINELKSPREFQSEPRTHLAAERDIRRRGLDVLAVYHSHPSSAPRPSQKDRERNYSERIVNLIIGLATATPEVAAWWISEDGSAPAAWAIV